MQVSHRSISLIKQYEGCKLRAYKDSAGVWTIGWGSTMYEDGNRVRPGDKITRARADELLLWGVGIRSIPVNALVAPTKLTQGQFDALVSFAYNLGIGALQRSTLLKLVRVNPKNPAIADEFAKWVNAGGKRLNGLVKRRVAEAALYFS